MKYIFKNSKGVLFVRALWVSALSLILALGALVYPASAATDAERDFSLRYDVLSQGANLAQIGNLLTTCGGQQLAYDHLSCTNTRSGNTGYSTWYNDDYPIVFVDVDGDGSTFNSSTADLTIPAGAEILRAQLYWGGSFNPSSLWSQSLAQVMKFKGPTGGYNDIAANVLDYKDILTDAGTGRSYGATANVTSLFTANSWGSGTYSGANVKATLGCTSGRNCDSTESRGRGSLGNYAGWALLLVYRDVNDPLIRYVGINDGFKCVVGVGSSCPDEVSVTFTGFNVPAGSTGNRWGILAWDGDSGIGDDFYLNEVRQSDSAHPVENYFRSRISVNGSVVTTRNPNYTNTLGMDIVESNTGNFAGGTTSVSGRFNTGGELDVLHYFWLVTESTAVDYGDAPESYGSASHNIGLTATKLRLGTATTDPESGMQSNASANGDDTNGTDDEDGVTFPPFYSNMTSYSVTVQAQNIFGQDATLYAWLDLNRNGIFEASEFVSVAIPNGTNGPLTLTWSNFPAMPAGTVLYSRFRITTQTLTDNGGTAQDERALGEASNGEVEDHRVTITNPPTAITLVAFSAEPKPDKVLLSWETGNELNIVRFNVWRSTKRNGNYAQVNVKDLVAQHVGTVKGDVYEFRDKTVKAGKTYFYKIEVVSVTGTLEWSDVKKVTVP